MSFGEIMTIGVVALVVLGPERLPTVARTLGALFGRAQRFVASVKSDISQHGQMAGFDDLKKDMQEAADVFRNRIESETAEVRQIAYDISQAGQSFEQDARRVLDDASRQISLPSDEAAMPAEVDERQLDLFDTLPPAVDGKGYSVVNARE